MDPVFFAAAFTALVVVYRVYCRYTRISLADVPGPDSASFIMGVFLCICVFSIIYVVIRESERGLSRTSSRGRPQVASSIRECRSFQGRVRRM